MIQGMGKRQQHRSTWAYGRLLAEEKTHGFDPVGFLLSLGPDNVNAHLPLPAGIPSCLLRRSSFDWVWAISPEPSPGRSVNCTVNSRLPRITFMFTFWPGLVCHKARSTSKPLWMALSAMARISSPCFRFAQASAEKP